MVLKRVIYSLCLAGYCVFTLCGCSAEILDKIRPEVNKGEMLVVFPQSFEEGDLLESDDGTEAGVPTEYAYTAYDPAHGTTENTTGTEIPERSPLQYDVIDSTTYAQYLKENIYNPICDVIKEAAVDNPDAMDKVYFRMFHIGQNLSESGTGMERSESSVMNNGGGGLVNSVGGPLLNDLTNAYIGSSTFNLSAKQSAMSGAKAAISPLLDKYGSDYSTSEEATKELGEAYVKMWKGSRYSGSTLRAYYVATQSDTEYLYAVPDLDFKYASTSTANGVISMNSVKTLTSGLGYETSFNVTNVYGLFTTVNQFETRGPAQIRMNESDEHAIVWAYIDGYSTTIIIVGTDNLTTLAEQLGSGRASQIAGIVSGTCTWAEYTTVRGSLSDGSQGNLLYAGMTDVGG